MAMAGTWPSGSTGARSAISTIRESRLRMCPAARVPPVDRSRWRHWTRDRAPISSGFALPRYPRADRPGSASGDERLTRSRGCNTAGQRLILSHRYLLHVPSDYDDVSSSCAVRPPGSLSNRMLAVDTRLALAIGKNQLVTAFRKATGIHLRPPDEEKATRLLSSNRGHSCHFAQSPARYVIRTLARIHLR
jgi:hypothetical protein